MSEIAFLPPWVETTLQPAFYDKESGTCLQQTARMYNKVNQLIRTVNDQNETIADYIQQFIDLKDYCEDYFENLDVQEEINNKLDQMAQDGSLTALIKAYIDPIIEEQNENIAIFENSVTTTVDNYQTSVNGTIAEMDTKVNAVTSGTPLVASSTAGMTNTSRIYVNTTDGNWYYHDGDSWEIGGTYQSSGISDGAVTLKMLANDTVHNIITRIDDKDKLLTEDSYQIKVSDLIVENKTLSAVTGEETDSDASFNLATQFIYLPYGYTAELSEHLSGISTVLYFYESDFTYIYRETVYNGSSGNPRFANRLNGRLLRIRWSDNSQSAMSPTDVANIVVTIKRFLPNKTNNSIGTNLVNPSEYIPGYLTNSGEYRYVESEIYRFTKPIKIKAGTTYFISYARHIWLYDTNLEEISGSWVGTAQEDYTFTPVNDGYITFTYQVANYPFMCVGSTGTATPYVETLSSYVQVQNIDNIEIPVNKANILYGKKYVALGDSFTHGDFTNAPEDDYHIEDGIYAGQYKVYPYLIGNRNNMNIINLAVNGMTLAHYPSDNNNYITDTVLSNIPADADYITIKIGINDSHKNVPIGTIDNNDRSTFYGAWNTILPTIINAHKQAKIGIIVSNGTDTVDYVNATIAIAKKYGLSYINESTDDRVPLLIRTFRSDVDNSIKTLRNNYWFVSTTAGSTNGHPNAKCHEYESTIIENFIRSL